MDEKLILKYIKGLSTSEEKKELLDWIDRSDDNKKYYHQMRELWDLLLITTEYPENSNDAFEVVKRKIAQPDQPSNRIGLRKILVSIGKIAAVAVLVIIASQYYFTNRQNSEIISYNKVEVPIGNRVKIRLPDKTIVWLNSGTTMSYPEKFTGKERVVSLNGEAQFEVTKDDDKPFVVKTLTHSITVLGTLFNVYAYDESNQYEATLLKGSIMLQNNDAKISPITMEVGQHVAYDKMSHTMEINNIDSGQMFSWISGYYSFDKVKFSNMLERLGQYYNKKTDIRNPMIADYECTGKFKTGESLEHILNVVKVNKPFKYTITEQEIIIY